MSAMAVFLVQGRGHAGDQPLGHGSWAIRGCNYYPKDFPWGGGAMWTQCPSRVYEADCALMKGYGINTVRVYLPIIPTADHHWYQSDGAATRNLLNKLRLFLTACRRNGIRAIICFDAVKASIDDGSTGTDPAKNWFQSVIIPLKHDSRILAWDVINEPDADPDPNKSWTPNMANYVGTMYHFAKSLTGQPVTVGMAWRGDELKSIGVSPDIYQYHEYSGGSESQIRQTLQNVQKAWPGKPVLVGEYGLDTSGTGGGHTEAGQYEDYKNVLDAVSATGGIWGTCFWTLWDFPGVNGAEGKFGLLHGDGSPKPALQTILRYY